jgi:hypothetical protein
VQVIKFSKARRFAARLAALAAVALSTNVFPPPAHAAAFVEVHNLANLVGGGCLTLAGGSTALYAQAVQYTCDGHRSRSWTQDWLDDRFRLRNANSGLCLTINGGSEALYAPAIQYYCDWNPARLWRFSGSDPRRGQLINDKSGMCLTPDGGSTANNVRMIQYHCDFNVARLWYLATA